MLDIYRGPDLFVFAVSMIPYAATLASASFGLAEKSQFFPPVVNGRIFLSSRLFVIGNRPSLIYSLNPFWRFNAYSIAFEIFDPRDTWFLFSSHHLKNSSRIGLDNSCLLLSFSSGSKDSISFFIPNSFPILSNPCLASVSLRFSVF